MEIYYEKNIVNQNIDKHSKRNTVLRVCKTASAVIFAGLLFFMLCFQPIPIGEGALAVVFNIALSLLFISPFVFAYFIFSRTLNRLNAEYDYYISGDIFCIMQVLNRKKRKKFVEFPLSAISSVGFFETESYDRYSADRSIKKINAVCNDDVDYGYFYYVADGEKRLLTMEFDAEFLQNLRRALPMSTFDGSVKDYLHKISKETQQ